MVSQVEQNLAKKKNISNEKFTKTHVKAHFRLPSLKLSRSRVGTQVSTSFFKLCIQN